VTSLAVRLPQITPPSTERFTSEPQGLMLSPGLFRPSRSSALSSVGCLAM
jgi:hypothetical protein